MQTSNADINKREQRGREIFEEGSQIKRLNANHYRVNSQSRQNRSYDVSMTESGWICECPDAYYRRVQCKHIFAVLFSLEIRREVEVCKIEPVIINSCIYCNSFAITKFGIRHNKHSDIQKFMCKTCEKYFTINIGFEKMKHNPQGITTAMQLYFSGESLRNTAKSLRLIGMDVSHQTIYNWIQKYIGLMQKYLDKIQPNVSNTWRADELYIKVKGNMKYLFALMDDETRYWIAQEVADTKDKHDASLLFRKGKEIAGKRPETIITDGLNSYHTAYMKAFWTQRKPRTKHIKEISFDGELHNNKMERLNGEVRDREKVMRGLKKKETPILKGYQIFHNYIREHKGLNGKTPSEACGINIVGDNKWLTLIQNARKRTTS